MKNQFEVNRIKPVNVLGIIVVLVWSGLSPLAQALVPVPAGGYPGFNTAGGQNALFSLTTGIGNTAVGWYSLKSNQDGSFNTAVGAGTLLFNVGDPSAGEGINNTALGGAALLFNLTGSKNTAVGTQALFSNTEGVQNTATGYQALVSNTTGFFNTAVGVEALFNNTEGTHNTANGYRALFNNTTGVVNTANGTSALEENTTGNDNTATGISALRNNTTGDLNTANGAFALASNTTGSNSTATGISALGSNTIGENNTANGAFALNSNTTGSLNTAVGLKALFNNTTGGSNTAEGDLALFNNTTGTGNVALGSGAGFNATTGNNNVYIGEGMQGVDGESNACYIRSIFNQPSPGGLTVAINSNNKLGTIVSSKRFKEDIKPMDKASEAVLVLKPVTFRYKKEIDPAGTSQFGLVAEEVDKVNPDLVVRDKQGKPYSVRYDQVNAMLLNEFLKEHKKVEAQQATITELKSTVAQQEKGMELLTAQLKEQAAQIQKVSAQVDAAKPLPHLVLNNP